MSGTCVPRPPKSPPYRSAAEIAEDIPPMPQPADDPVPLYVKIPLYAAWVFFVAFFGWSFGDTYGSAKGHKEGMRDAVAACRDEVVVIEGKGASCSHHEQRSSVAWTGGSIGLLCTCPRR
jgi:hypothetical protein